MNRTTEILSQRLESEGQNQKLTQQCNANGDGPRLVACVLLLPEDAEVLAELLHSIITNPRLSQELDSLTQPECFARPEPSDSWLPHVEAAKFLGVSKSTLYRYACQERIECRKIAGRLEYRQSSLESLKQKQIRPARLPLGSGGIIPSTLNSGK
jgi:predicted DNA-binding transcriptional regulator AlpA